MVAGSEADGGVCDVGVRLGECVCGEFVLLLLLLARQFVVDAIEHEPEALLRVVLSPAGQ